MSVAHCRGSFAEHARAVTILTALVRVALLFIDGVGVGTRDAAINPLTGGEFLLSQFSDGSGAALPAGGQRFDVDTTFGVPGRPQSASNQTAILTGRPAPQLTGQHLLGYPNAPLKQLLADHSIARQLTTAGKSVTFANAYPVAYLDALGLKRRAGNGPDVMIPPKYLKRIKPSASTLAMAAGGVALRTFDDARAGHGLTHDVDGHVASRRVDVPRRTPAEAAEIFWNLSADFTLFEHYLADEAGHAQDRAAALDALGTFDAFARAAIAARPADAHLLICSDHGNVEDLSTRSHTVNRVAVLSFGPATFERPETVADVGRSVLSILGVAT
jgi:hypothetical protein